MAAVGGSSLASGYRATGVGHSTQATGRQATAVGYAAVSSHKNSTAIGANATTTADNQVVLSGAGSSVVVADINASTAQQTGDIYTVTIDANGNLGRGPAISMASVSKMVSRLANTTVAGITDIEFTALSTRVDGLEGRVDGLSDRLGGLERDVLALNGRVDNIEGQVGELFDLAAADRRDFRQGLAAVAAMAHPHFPSEDGRTSYASNVAVHRGFVGVSAGLMHRIDRGFAISAGVTYGGGESTTVKAGIAGEF